MSCEVHRAVRERGPVQDEVPAYWQFNRDGSSYWKAELPPQWVGTLVSYWLVGDSPKGRWVQPNGRWLSSRCSPSRSSGITTNRCIGILLRRRYAAATACLGCDLHALRDYYTKTALLLDYPDVHVTINVTPVLLWQLDDYVQRGATDRALELSVTDVSELGRERRRELLSSFFEADWHRQIMPHPRYRDLFARRRAGGRLSTRDLRDLQMWFNLCWFAREFREGEVLLCTGEVASVRRFVEKGEGFTGEDCRAMVAENTRFCARSSRCCDCSRSGARSSSRLCPSFTRSCRCWWTPAPRCWIGLVPRYRRVSRGQRMRSASCSPPWRITENVSGARRTVSGRRGSGERQHDSTIGGAWGRVGGDEPRRPPAIWPVRVSGRAPGSTLPTLWSRDLPGWSRGVLPGGGAVERIGFRYQHVGDAGAAARELVAALKRPFRAEGTGAPDPVVTLVSDGEN